MVAQRNQILLDMWSCTSRSGFHSSIHMVVGKGWPMIWFSYAGVDGHYVFFALTFVMKKGQPTDNNKPD